MPDPMTRGVEATINCTVSNGLKPPKVTVIFSPVEIDVSATIGVDAAGSARTTASAGAGKAVGVTGVAVAVGATVFDGVDGLDGAEGADGVDGAAPGIPVIENLNIWLRSGFIPPGRWVVTA